MTEKLIATATFGLESVVSRELATLGYEARVVRPGWLSFTGDALAIARTNLWLRASDRVLLEMGSFEARDFGALFDETSAIAWERYLPPNASFPVRGRSVRSQLSSVPACQKIVKKAVVERLRKAHRVRTLPEDGPTFSIEIALLKDQATLAIDTSGPGLHKRGYRPLSGRAPLKETLAAGLVLLSFWDRDRPLFDPFCGTGTIPIEAALIARNRAPGSTRQFAAESWPTLPKTIWTEARYEARSLERPALELPLEGSDIDPEALELARLHARKAGAQDDVRFSERAFADASSEREYGCIITNPPYGDRIGDARAVGELYRSFPDVLRRFSTWSHYILTSRADLESIVGQKADRRRKLYNGRIECTYFQFHGPRPGGKSSTPAFGGLSGKGAQQIEVFANRLRKRARHLRKWPRKHGIDAFRLYDHDIKEVPIAVDRYGELVLVTPGSDSKLTRTTAEQAEWLDRIVETVCEVLEVPDDDVLLAGRPGGERRTVVHENGLDLEVRLTGTSEPGLPLDGRVLRQRLREMAAGRRVLSFPSRAGTYAVAAAAGGASSVTSVDTSEERHAWARRNFELNGLETSSPRFLTEFEESERFDLAVVDRADSDAVAKLMAPDGVLFIVSHDRKRREGAEDVTDAMLPEDFRSRRRFRCWKRVLWST